MTRRSFGFDHSKRLNVSHPGSAPRVAGSVNLRSVQVSYPRVLVWFASVGLFGATGSCGGNPTPSATPKLAPTVSHPAPQSQGSVRTAQRPAPEGLFLVGRLRRLKETTSEIAQWCAFPFDIDDALAASGDEIAKQIRLDLPVDFAVSLAAPRDPDVEQDYAPRFDMESDGGVAFEETEEPSLVNGVASVAVTDPSALLKAFEEAGMLVEADESGEFVVSVDRDLHCLLGPSLGESSHRLACGLRREDLEVLGGFVNTTLATSSFPDKSLYTELRFEPLRARYGNDIRQLRSALPVFLKEASIGSERFDRAFDQAARATVDEVIAWADGFDVWSMSLQVDPQRDVLVSESTLTFRKDESYLAAMLQRSAAANGAAPALFWDLPHDVDAASFSSRPVTHESDKRIADTVAELFAGGLEYAGVASGVLDTWVKSFRGLIESPGTVVFATGSVPAPVSGGKKVVKDAGVLDSFGYYLVGVEGDNGSYARAWRTSVATFNDTRFRAELSKKLGDDFPKLPLFRHRKLASKKNQPVVDVYDLTFALPKSELASDWKMKKLGLYVTVATVGERTWFGMGFSERDATFPVRQLTSGEEYGKLATRDGLASLHADQMYQGSFATLQSYAKWLRNVPFLPNSEPLGDALTHVMPHHGLTPAVFELRTSAPGPAMTAKLEIPRQTFEDGTALFVAVAAAYASAFKNVGMLLREGE